MTAKEMFEKKGYLLVLDSESTMVYRNSNQTNVNTQKYVKDIVFGKGKIRITYYALGIFNHNGQSFPLFIDNDLHLAITQQMKELEWL